MPRAPEQLRDRRLGPGHARRRHAAHRVPPHELQPDPRVDEPLAHDRIVDRRRARARASNDVVELALEADLLRERRHAALEAEQRPSRRASPSPTSPTTRSALGARVVEEHLVELAAAGDLHDRAHLDARLVHRHEQEREALVPRPTPGSVRATTKHQCDTCASDVHTFWPLITHSSPSSTRPGLRRWRGRSPRWARCSPGTSARRRGGSPGRNRSCCSGVPYAMSVGREQVLAHVVDARRRLARARTPRPR